MLVIVGLLLLAAAWLAPTWNETTWTFSLRVRNGAEAARFVGELAGPLEQRFSKLIGSPPRTPQVGAGAPEEEQLTDSDRVRLDRLIEEKTRDR